MKPEVFEACVAASFDGSMIFPQIVGMLDSDGVEWYSANLLIGVTTGYAEDGSHLQAKWPGIRLPAIGREFKGQEVEAAIRDSQAGRIHYPEFLERIAAAGVTYYTVHIKGRKAIYFGRHGNFHIEPFPAGSSAATI